MHLLSRLTQTGVPGSRIANNRIAETRDGDARTQHYGVFKKAGSGSVTMQGNTMEGHISKDFFEAPR